MSLSISIITLHSVQNYGSVLQTYASQRVFEKLGCEVLIVDYVRENNLRENLTDTYLLNSGFWNKNFATRALFKILKENDLKKRYDIFWDFLKRYINLTPERYLGEEDFKKYPIETDIYCTGSDQTWNTYWNRGILPPFFLSYAPKGRKKIAFSASFGTKELAAADKPRIKEYLEKYDCITVREQEGVDILRELGIEAKRILDPTLLLSKDEWLGIASERMIKGKYILIYQLSHSGAFDRAAKAFAKYKGLKPVRIGFGNEAYLYGGHVVKNPDVGEFLSLLANAEYIITDSFHATSFAVNFNVEFFCFLPKLFPGRINDFLALVGLEGRCFSSFEELKEISQSKIDFESVNIKTEEERRRSLAAAEGMIMGEKAAVL